MVSLCNELRKANSKYAEKIIELEASIRKMEATIALNVNIKSLESTDHVERLAFAGLWEQWWGDDKNASPLESCTIITTDANALASQIHNRMPVILSPNDYRLWLDPEIKDTTKVAILLDQFPDERMSVRPVSTYVNNARHEGPECILNSA